MLRALFNRHGMVDGVKKNRSKVIQYSVGVNGVDNRSSIVKILFTFAFVHKAQTTTKYISLVNACNRNAHTIGREKRIKVTFGVSVLLFTFVQLQRIDLRLMTDKEIASDSSQAAKVQRKTLTRNICTPFLRNRAVGK